MKGSLERGTHELNLRTLKRRRRHGVFWTYSHPGGDGGLNPWCTMNQTPQQIVRGSFSVLLFVYLRSRRTCTRSYCMLSCEQIPQARRVASFGSFLNEEVLLSLPTTASRRGCFYVTNEGLHKRRPTLVRLVTYLNLCRQHNQLLLVLAYLL